MFFWTRTRRTSEDRNTKAARTFRPEGDRLEAREVLSTFGLAGASTSHNAAGMAFHGASNGFTGLTTNFVARPQGPQNLAGVSAAVSQLSRGNAATGLSNAFNNAVNLINSRNLPREAGLSNSVNPNIARINSLIANSLSPFTMSANSTANNAALSASSAVTNGLAFTSGLGFTNRAFQPTNTVGNSAQNGLAFTNGSGFSTPSFGSSNSANNGLAFTSGLGFSRPGGNASLGASNGLAFTNGTGFSLPTLSNNSATSGLAFGSGLGFNNQRSNPFLSGLGLNNQSFNSFL